jgi:hypothetical protein
VIPSPPSPRNDGLISRYEELRHQVLGRANEFHRAEGLALLMRSGMSVWMQAWTHCAAEIPAPPKERLGDEAIFPFAMHREVTMILAAMVLCGRQEAIA